VIETAQTLLEYFIFNDGGDLTLHNNCWLGNDDVIAPVVNDDGGQALAYMNSVQRQTTVLPPTDCDFMSLGHVDTDTFQTAKHHSCQTYDSPVCTAFALTKVMNPPCVEDLKVIYEIERDLDSDNATRTYRLCPDTKYNMLSSGGAEVGDSVTEHVHEPPIVIGRSNIHLICGADGKSSNNCILDGGYIQLIVHNEFDVPEEHLPASNAVVQGITFTGAISTNVLVQSTMPIHIKFHDCIFKVRSILRKSLQDIIRN